MENKNVKNNAAENEIATVPYIVYEAEQARSERRDKRQITALLIAIALLFIGNLVWLYVWSQYDYSGEESTTTIELDSSGDGNANFIGNDGDINNGAGKGYENNKEADTDT